MTQQSNALPVQEEPAGNISQALDMVQQIKLVNADEHIPDEVVIKFREWETIEEPDENGTMRKRNKARVRTARISSFVPTDVFIQMMSSQQARKDANDKSLGTQIRWMQEQILMVWKLSEEDMTLPRLQKGIDALKTMELYFDFFGKTLAAAQSIKVPQGANMPNGSQ